MLKSCQYCGTIHDSKYICSQKAQSIRRRRSWVSEKNKKIDSFRKTNRWKEKSVQIRERDSYCCQVCSRQKPPQYVTKEISVHHIEPISEAWERRLDDDNLITLCSRHHEAAECGEIKRETLRGIAEGQEKNNEGPVCG